MADRRLRGELGLVVDGGPGRHLDRAVGLPVPEGYVAEPRMQRQSDGLNDDWVRRYSKLRLGTELDLVPAVPERA